MTPQEHALVNLRRLGAFPASQRAGVGPHRAGLAAGRRGIHDRPCGRRVGGGSVRPRSRVTLLPRPRPSIHLFMAGGPSHLDLFDYKPAVGQARRQADAARGHRRSALRLHPRRRAALGPALQIRQARTMRSRNCRSAAAPGRRRRRHLPGTLGAHRSVQSRPGPDFFQYRLLAARAGPAWARGSRTGWAPRRRTCRPSS